MPNSLNQDRAGSQGTLSGFREQAGSHLDNISSDNRLPEHNAFTPLFLLLHMDNQECLRKADMVVATHVTNGPLYLNADQVILYDQEPSIITLLEVRVLLFFDMKRRML